MSTTFTVDGLAGITFTAALDPDVRDWLLIEGRNRDDELVSRTGISVTRDIVEDVTATPEPVLDTDGPAALRDAALTHLRDAIQGGVDDAEG